MAGKSIQPKNIVTSELRCLRISTPLGVFRARPQTLEFLPTSSLRYGVEAEHATSTKIVCPKKSELKP